MRKRVFEAKKVIINGVDLESAYIKFETNKTITIGDKGCRKLNLVNYARVALGNGESKTFEIDDYKGTFSKYEVGLSQFRIEDPKLERELPQLKMTLLMGVQASGKTTIAENYLVSNSNTKYICSDQYWPVDEQGLRYWTDEDGERRCWYTDPLPSELKEKAYSWAHRRLLEHIDSGESILFEGTLVDKHTRRKVIYDAWMSCYEVHGIFLLPSLLVCAQRNAERKHPVPDVALARTYSKVELPTQEEGFSSLKIIRMD
jgi:predicted kinase